MGIIVVDKEDGILFQLKSNNSTREPKWLYPIDRTKGDSREKIDILFILLPGDNRSRSRFFSFSKVRPQCNSTTCQKLG
jgi:hypothetical protein